MCACVCVFGDFSDTSQENERLVEEWVGYLSQVKRARGKQHMELPTSGERSKVSK